MSKPSPVPTSGIGKQTFVYGFIVFITSVFQPFDNRITLKISILSYHTILNINIFSISLEYFPVEIIRITIAGKVSASYFAGVVFAVGATAVVFEVSSCVEV
jgi:hypothetical protein